MQADNYGGHEDVYVWKKNDGFMDWGEPSEYPLCTDPLSTLWGKACYVIIL